MGPSIASEILRAVVSGLILAIFFGAIATWVWTIPRLFRGQPLLPEEPIVERRRTPWGVGTILLVAALYYGLASFAFATYGRAAHPAGARARGAPVLAKPAPKGEEKPDQGTPPEAPAKPDVPPPQPHPDAKVKEADELPFGLTPFEAMSIQGAINGLFILLLPGLARLTSGARPRDFGLSLGRWRRQVGVGIVAVLVLMPIVYSVQAACLRLLDMSAPEIEKNRHPLEKMLRDSLSPGIASMAFLTAVVLAPVFEELLFRGFLQSWLVTTLDRFANRRRSEPVEEITGDPPLLGTNPADPLADPDLDRFPVEGPDAGFDYWEAAEAPTDEIEPASLPGDDVETGAAPFRPRSPFWTSVAIALTSLIFAALHAPQWPAPIPLFLLAMGLGYVAQRTGSLTASICMHAIFNGFSTMMLFYVALEQPDRPKPPPGPILERVIPAEKAGAVAPGVGPGPRPDKT